MTSFDKREAITKSYPVKASKGSKEANDDKCKNH